MNKRFSDSLKVLLSLCFLFYAWNFSNQHNEQLENRIVKYPRLFCICSTTTPRHRDRVKAVRKTWGKRCDRLIFASDSYDYDLQTYQFFPASGRKYISFKMYRAWIYVYKNFISKEKEYPENEYHWFVKGDDDTFIIVENLRKHLARLDPSEPHYMGHPFSKNDSIYHRHYISGALEILSKESVRRLVERAMPYTDLCPTPKLWANEDAFLGYCLGSIGIKPNGLFDEIGRNRFMALALWNHFHYKKLTISEGHLIQQNDKTYTKGEMCCAPDAISFHYSPNEYMLSLEFLIYRLKSFTNYLNATGKDEEID